jgi:hypothetical protein
MKYWFLEISGMAFNIKCTDGRQFLLARHSSKTMNWDQFIELAQAMINGLNFLENRPIKMEKPKK